MLKGTVVFISLLAVAVAYQALAPLESKPDKFKNEAGCYMSILDKMIPFGESYSRAPIGKELCEKFSCGHKYVQITGCGAVSASPPCTLEVLRDKPYPDCCPTIKCPSAA